MCCAPSFTPPCIKTGYIFKSTNCSWWQLDSVALCWCADGGPTIGISQLGLTDQSRQPVTFVLSTSELVWKRKPALRMAFTISEVQHFLAHFDFFPQMVVDYTAISAGYIYIFNQSTQVCIQQILGSLWLPAASSVLLSVCLFVLLFVCLPVCPAQCGWIMLLQCAAGCKTEHLFPAESKPRISLSHYAVITLRASQTDGASGVRLTQPLVTGSTLDQCFDGASSILWHLDMLRALTNTVRCLGICFVLFCFVLFYFTLGGWVTNSPHGQCVTAFADWESNGGSGSSTRWPSRRRTRCLWQRLSNSNARKSAGERI